MPIYQGLNKKLLNPKLTGIILGILITGTVFLIGIEYNSTLREINELGEKTAQIETALREFKERVIYVIDKGEGSSLFYQIVPTENSTVLSLLEELARRENFEIEYKIYEDMGVFVESIFSMKGGTDNKWWQYWVNEKLPTVAADKYWVKSGDEVEWKFAPSPF